MVKVKAEKNKFDAILNVFAWVSFFIALIVAVTVLLSTFSGSKNGKPVFGYKMLIVESDSMSKSEISQDEKIYFNANDLIFIKQVKDVSKIKVGDVITFISYNPESKGKTVSHKVRSIKTSSSGEILGFETYGINTGASDQVIVDPSTIIGKYAGKSASLGRLFKYFKTPAGYFTSILIPCVLLIIFFSIKVGKMIAKKEVLDKYDLEFATLKIKLTELEKLKEEGYMQQDLQTMESVSAQIEEGVQNNQDQVQTANQAVQGVEQQAISMTQPVIQVPNINAIDLMAKTLSSTIELLTKTIDSMAVAVGKPVDTLARSVETLATASAKPTVIEKVVEKPVVQTIIKEVPVEPFKSQSDMEMVTTEVPQEQEEKEEPTEVVTTLEGQAENSTMGGTFHNLKQNDKVAFKKKLLTLTSDIKEYFTEVHNELISYKKVNYRISFKGITYRVGRNTIAKMVVRGKTLKLHLALNVEEFSKTIFFQEDSSSVKAYEEVPFTVKIKSERAKNNALKLVSSLAEKNSFKKDDKFQKENILKVLRQYK